MGMGSPISSGTVTTNDFRGRNDKLFTRRKALVERVTELRAKLETGQPDMLSEYALRQAERELDDVTYEIMTLNYGLVRRYVATFTSRSTENSEDFESAGKVGLLWAISSYDPARGSFASWAFKPIQREVLRAVRDADHPNLNPGDFEKRPAILAAERAFLESSAPQTRLDYTEIARLAGVAEAQVRRVLEAPRLESLQAPVAGQSEDDAPWEERLADPLLDMEEDVLHRFQLIALKRAGLPRLDDRELYVLTRRFGLDGEPEESLRVIGDELGLSREGVRQIQQKALAKLSGPVEDSA